MTLKFKRNQEDSIPPYKGSDGAAGWDLCAHSPMGEPITIRNGQILPVHLGISVEIPRGMVGLLLPRSSLASKFRGLHLANSVGTIDSDYRGPLYALLQNPSNMPISIPHGTRIVQLIVVSHLQGEPVELEELSSTERGFRGFGSTGDEIPYYNGT